MKKFVFVVLICAFLPGCSAIPNSENKLTLTSESDCSICGSTLFSTKSSGTMECTSIIKDENLVQQSNGAIEEPIIESIDYKELLETHGAVFSDNNYNEFNGLTVARSSNGIFYETNDYKEFVVMYNDSNLISNTSPECIKVGDNIDDNLIADYACCVYYEESDAVVLEAIQYKGNIILSGILRKITSNDELGGVKEGDIFFYPFPESIIDIPLIFDEGVSAYKTIVDDKNNYYMLADTIEIYLGNSISQTITIDTDFNRQIELPLLPNEYTIELNNHISSYEYYTASIEFSQLFVQAVSAPKTGSFFSAGIISDILAIEPHQTVCD